MKTRSVTYAEAERLFGEWGDRRIRPLVVPSASPLDFSLEDACEQLCRRLADDPERDLDDVPQDLLRLLWARILFAVAACRLTPDGVIGNVPTSAPDSLVLQAILGTQIANTRLPPEWRVPPRHELH